MGIIRSPRNFSDLWSSEKPLNSSFTMEDMDSVHTGYASALHTTVSPHLAVVTTNGSVLVSMEETSRPTTPIPGISGATSVDDVQLATLSWDDATWILTSSFIIFTMQTGFGLIEAGSVNSKNEVNIMVKNAIDVIFGGISYWAFGFGLTFGIDEGTNPFCGIGYWFVESRDQAYMGQLYSTFIFQLSFATTATTIVSGAMAERTQLRAYIVFSLLNTIIYCIPAHWVWAHNGFLKTLGCVDVAGSGVVHLLGAGSAFMAAWMLGPRLGRYDKDRNVSMLGNETNAMIGMFMLWWGWLAFNSGSTFGISGKKWILAARAAVVTLNGSMGGGVTAIIFTSVKNKGQLLIPELITGIMGSLVSVTACCALIQPWEAVVIGACGGLLCCAAPILMNKLKVDDPVGAVAVHGFGGLWGMIAAGIFVDVDSLEYLGGESRGLVHGGGFYLLGVQALACVAILSWSMLLTWIILLGIKHTIGLRLSEWDEKMGSDLIEHGIHPGNTDHEQEMATVQDIVRNIHNFRQRRSSSIFGHRKGSTIFRSTTDSVQRSEHSKAKTKPWRRTTPGSVSNGFHNGGSDFTEETNGIHTDRVHTSLTDVETAGLY